MITAREIDKTLTAGLLVFWGWWRCIYNKIMSCRWKTNPKFDLEFNADCLQTLFRQKHKCLWGIFSSSVRGVLSIFERVVSKWILLSYFLVWLSTRSSSSSNSSPSTRRLRSTHPHFNATKRFFFFSFLSNSTCVCLFICVCEEDLGHRTSNPSSKLNADPVSLVLAHISLNLSAPLWCLRSGPCLENRWCADRKRDRFSSF